LLLEVAEAEAEEALHQELVAEAAEPEVTEILLLQKIQELLTQQNQLLN
jgi:hypothetical protein